MEYMAGEGLQLYDFSVAHFRERHLAHVASIDALIAQRPRSWNRVVNQLITKARYCSCLRAASDSFLNALTYPYHRRESLQLDPAVRVQPRLDWSNLPEDSESDDHDDMYDGDNWIHAREDGVSRSYGNDTEEADGLMNEGSEGETDLYG